MITPQLHEFIHKIPKTEVHVHLEGSIEPARALAMAQRHGLDLPLHDETSINKFYEFTCLDQFIGIYLKICEGLQDAEDYRNIVLDLGADSKAQNISYREVFFTLTSPGFWERPTEAVIEGLTAGRQEVQEKYGVELWFIADIIRNMEPEAGLEVVEEAHRVREKLGIIGIGLDASEKGHPAHKHKLGFDRARELGFRLVAHAGEDEGAESVWDALNSLKVERIDHGVRSIEDPALVKHLAEIRMPLTTCPVSNIALKVFPEMKQHSFKKLLDAGCFVTINSDDPPMFRANLVENYLQVADTFDLTIDEIVTIARNGFQATFMDDAKKTAYLKRFDAEVAQLRKNIFKEM
jgi:adenosine deaminase